MTKTAQEVFDFVANHLFTQGVQAMGVQKDMIGSTPICLYRGPEGTKCAVGAMIPDEEYEPEMEGFSVRDLPNLQTVIVNDDIMANMELLESLQCVHDVPANWDCNDLMRSALESVAVGFKLDHSNLKNLSLNR